MAIETKEDTIPTNELYTVTENGEQAISVEREPSAYEHLKHIIGIHKDDPYAQEVWDRIIASRKNPNIYAELMEADKATSTPSPAARS